MFGRKFPYALVALAVLLWATIIPFGCSDDDDDPVGPDETWAWRPLGTGTNYLVSALLEFDGHLFAGGSFTEAGGVAANYVAMWNDTVWSPLGTGTSWPVYAMTIYDNKLIVGGSFGSAGGITVNRVAAWDGSAWSALGTGVAGNVVIKDLTVARDSLFAVGSVGTGMDAEQIIAVWDGSTWGTFTPLDSGQAKASCALDSDLMVGGYYIENASVWSYVQRRSGGTWFDFNFAQLPGVVEDLTVWNGNVIAAGSNAHPVKYFSVQWWDMGTDAFTLAGFVPSVFALGEYNSNLVACGAFDAIGSTTVNGVASWNGSTWTGFGTGITDGNAGYCLAVRDSKLYMGGLFVEASGDTVNNIAVWSLE